MKNSDLLIVAAVAGFAWFLISGVQKKQPAGPSKAGPDNSVGGGVKVIQSYDGWTYYDNGGAIDRYGNYWLHGVMIYSATSGDTGAAEML